MDVTVTSAVIQWKVFSISCIQESTTICCTFSTNAVRLGKVEVAASSVGIRPEVDEWQSVDSWRLTLVGAKALLEPHYEVDY